MQSRGEQLVVFWNLNQKSIPPRPDDPGSYPLEDDNHWYDMEYAGWFVKKTNIPISPGTGTEGKKVVCLQPAVDMYQQEYYKGMKTTAEEAGIELKTYFANWNRETQVEQLERAINEKPDLIILNPEFAEESIAWYKQINESGIPVIGSNLLPAQEGFKYILSWTGPDDWGQSRLLARKFAELMHYRGGYCIFRHIKGSSSFYARTYGVICELTRIAPEMSCLSLEETFLEEETAYRRMTEVLKKYGKKLKGIVSADDNRTQLGINRAIAEQGREEIIRVACGSTDTGMQLIRAGKLDALAYQSAEIDGALAMKIAIDWFNELQIEPMRYLPKHIITGDNVRDFLNPGFHISNIDVDQLYRAIESCNEENIYEFFDDVYVKLLHAHIIKEEEFRGFSIEVFSNFLSIIKSTGLSEPEIIGSYEDMYKNLFHQRSLEKTLEWMIEMSLNLIRHISQKRKRTTNIQRIIQYVDQNYMEPISIKVLSYKYDISQVYLGQLFKRETGKNFPQYLNELRIEEAKKLFRTSNLKANEIAQKVGYSNPNYFYNIFKKYAGMYPSEFIEKMKYI